LWLFLALSFFNGCVMELGRKIRVPENEQEGVETYSKLWGPYRASLVWLAAVYAAVALLVSLILLTTGSRVLPLAAILALGGVQYIQGLGIRDRAAPVRQKAIELASAIWVALSYATCAALPFIGSQP